MGFNAINPDAAIYFRGVISNGGARSARGFRTVKQPPGTYDFIYPFILPSTPDLPDILIGHPVVGTGEGTTRPVYRAPTLTLDAAPTTGETGTVLPVINVTPTWTQNNAGNPISSQVTLGSNTNTGGGIAPSQFTNIQLTDTAQQLRASVTYAAGSILNDPEGNPDPVGSIPAGTIQSNVVNIVGYRKAFWATSAVRGSAPTSSAQVRGLSDSSTAGAQRSFSFVLPASTYDIIIATPALLGNNIDIRIPPTDMNQGMFFTRTQVSVAGADGTTMGMPYNVWFYSAVIPFAASNVNVTIS